MPLPSPADLPVSLPASHSQRSAPIGIFDSGIGGLTVAAAIAHALPHESMLYFGDTAHLPYGDKSSEAIQRYSVRIAQFLVEQGAKALVIACNSASAHGAAAVRAALPQLPVVDVIAPAVAYVASLPQPGKVGVIGTKATIDSQEYVHRLQHAAPHLQVASLPTPLLAPMIEEGFYNNTISHVVIHEYLRHTELQGVGTLILACTHYPLIGDQIADYYAEQHTPCDIVDTARCVARALAHTLAQTGLAAPEDALVAHRFCVSDFTESFEESTRLFFGEGLHLEHCPIWGEE